MVINEKCLAQIQACQKKALNIRMKHSMIRDFGIGCDVKQKSLQWKTEKNQSNSMEQKIMVFNMKMLCVGRILCNNEEERERTRMGNLETVVCCLRLN